MIRVAALWPVVCAAAIGAAPSVSRAQPAPPPRQIDRAAPSPAATTIAGSASKPVASVDAQSQPPAENAEPAARPGALAVATAIGPGLFYSGAGIRVAGDRDTSRRLARLHGASVAVLLAGGLPFAITRASRRVSGYSVPLMLMGSGGFFTTWWADIYGAATGGRTARPRTDLPDIEAEVGYAYVVDPRFDYEHFTALSAVGRWRQWSLRTDAMLATDDPTQRVEATAAYRWFGPAPGGAYALGAGDDGSFVDLTVGGVWHRQAGDGFTVYTPWLGARGRLDMARVGPALAGSFIDLSVGVGVELYDIDGASGVSPVGLQLARFGYGLYLGSPNGRYGEVVAYYDHRHDDFAAGLGTGGQFDGPWGHLGVSGFFYPTRRWGVGAEFEAGSAYVSRLTARFAWRSR